MMKVSELSSEEQVKLLFTEAKQLQGKHFKLPCSKRMEYDCNVLTRHLLTTYTLWNIIHPPERKDLLSKSESPSDFASAFVLLRSMYETFLTSNYILVSEEFDKCRNAIIEVAELHACREQRILATNIGSRSDQMDQLLLDIDVLTQSISKHDEWSQLPEYVHNYVDDLNNSNKKLFKKDLESIAKLAKIHPSVHLQYYKYFSNYAHSNPLSVRQVGAIRSPIEAREMMSGVAGRCVHFFSRAIDLHRKVSITEGFIANLSKDVEDLIQLWYEAGKIKLIDWG